MNRRHKLYLIIYHLFVTLTHISPQLTCLTPPPPLTEYATTGRVWCLLVRFVIQYIEGGGPLLSPIGNYKEDTARSFHHHQGHIQGWGLGEENRINCIKIDPSDESERKLVHLLPLLPVPYVHMPPIPPPCPYYFKSQLLFLNPYWYNIHQQRWAQNIQHQWWWRFSDERILPPPFRCYLCLCRRHYTHNNLGLILWYSSDPSE